MNGQYRQCNQKQEESLQKIYLYIGADIKPFAPCFTPGQVSVILSLAFISSVNMPCQSQAPNAHQDIDQYSTGISSTGKKKDAQANSTNPRPQATSATSFLFLITDTTNQRFMYKNKMMASIR